MITHRLTRIVASAAIALGTLGATLAGAAQTATPAAAQEWHGGNPGPGHWDRFHHWHHDGWRDRAGHWHDGAARPAPGYYAVRGPRFYDRAHGYWRDNRGYWNPHTGLYVSFHL